MLPTAMPARLSMSVRRTSGFTLVELLVVIGIIAVLIAILMPVLAKVQQQSLLTKCLSNQRQLGQATSLYAVDYKGWLPRDGMSGVNLGFFAPYLVVILGYPEPESMERVNSDVDYAVQYFRPIPVVKCPAVGDSDYVLHYVVNSLDFEYYMRTGKYAELGSGQRGNTKAFAPITQTKDASKTGYIFEVNMSTLGPTALGSYNVWKASDLPYRTPPDANAPAPYTSGNRMIAYNDPRHQGKTTVVFFDGHVEVRALVPAQFPITILNPWAQ